MRGRSHTRWLDHVIAAWADARHGLVSRAQLLELGVGAKAIDHRVARGVLHVVHRGVDAAGHRVLSREGHWLAAVLAAGPGAVLSHRAPAALWGIRDGRGASPETIAAQLGALTAA